MTIRVEMETGERRIVEIELPAVFHDGEVLNRITDSNGVDHYFTKDGHYDGWGAPMCGQKKASGM